jgi:CrcB protein
MIRQILLVAAGGAAGSVLRFLTTIFTARFFTGIFPLATFIANIAGCFLIGLLVGLFPMGNPANQQLRLLLITGFCGGYTTFSTFSYENFSLIDSGNGGIAILYMLASVAGGLVAVWLGMMVSGPQ